MLNDHQAAWLEALKHNEPCYLSAAELADPPIRQLIDDGLAAIARKPDQPPYTWCTPAGIDALEAYNRYIASELASLSQD